MQQPPQITFRHMDVSPAAETRIMEEVAALEHCYERITSCHIVVEAPHQRHQRGQPFQVNIDLHVRGSQIVVNHNPSSHATLARAEAQEAKKSHEEQPDHKDLYVSIRDAFAAARRQLQDYAQVLRGDVKNHRGKASIV